MAQLPAMHKFALNVDEMRLVMWAQERKQFAKHWNDRALQCTHNISF